MQGLGSIKTLKVSVHDLNFSRVTLQILDNDFFGFTVFDFDFQNVREERFVFYRMQNVIMSDGQHSRLFVRTIDNCRHLTGMTQAAARTLPCVSSKFCSKSKCCTHVDSPK